ncbi:MAG TPA: hypothetical protein VFJ79_01875 [Acidimicrobiales bacterium]|nr:hypothetical protein [Acidimicrobiales bacterium]
MCAVTSDDAMTADWARLPTTAGAAVEPDHQRGPRRETGWRSTSRRSRPAPSSGNKETEKPCEPPSNSAIP